MVGFINQTLSYLGLEGLRGVTYLGNSIFDYLAAIIVFFVVLVVLKIFKQQIIGYLKRLSQKTKSDLDDMLIDVIDTVGWPLYLLISLKIAIFVLVLPVLVVTMLDVIILVVAAYYIIKAVQKVIDFFIGKIEAKKRSEGATVNKTLIDLIKKIFKGIAWLAVLLIILSGLGVDITGAVVGMGVGGIVIGFALQNVLSDLFASFSLYFDRPFEKGDFIVIGGNDMGTVENIGLMSTRIKHLKGHELVVSNSELTKIRINNYKKMQKRRVVFSFGVVYQTSSQKLRRIPEMVKEIINKIDRAELDRVHFKSFGDSSLDFEVVYYVDTQDYNKYMDTQQEINFMLKERFEKEGIEFAYPTRTVFLEK